MEEVENRLEKHGVPSQENKIKSGGVNFIGSMANMGMSHSVSIWQTVLCC